MIQGTPPVPPEIPAPPFDPNLFFLSEWGAPVLVMIVALSLLAATIILWPVMRALGRRLELKSAGDPALRAELEQLQHRLGDVDQLQQRVAELEERIDFTERMLARGQSPAALPGDTQR
jgi:Tfp pilus assembly protein PilO